MHSFNLLVAFGPGLLERLVFLFDPLDFTLDFFFPSVMQIHLALFIFTFEFANLVKLCFLLDFHQGLFHGLGKEHIQNWLNLALVVEKVVIAYLGDFINTSLLGNVLGGSGSGLEGVGLTFDFHFLCLCTALLCEIIS